MPSPSASRPKSVSVIIVTYNSAACILDCVRSVLAQQGVDLEILVVDNASSDHTPDLLKGLDCRVIANAENLGFGRANNVGFAASQGKYAYLLNPDAKLVSPDSLAKTVERMENTPEWGMAGTRILSSTGEDVSPPATAYPGQRHVRRDFTTLPGKIAWILGASMIIRRELYEKLGGFDPGFFLYSEETDLCLRLRELGFAIGHLAEVAVEHVGGASEDPRDPYLVSMRKTRGLLRFRQKHYLPGECVWLARHDLRRASFRMLWNGLLARVQKPGSGAWCKYRSYQAIREVSRDYLQGGKIPD